MPKWNVCIWEIYRTLLFSYVSKQISENNGFTASFMPKPFENHNRNAFHTHLSMQNFEGRNLFYDESAEYQLSDACPVFHRRYLEICQRNIYYYGVHGQLV